MQSGDITRSSGEKIRLVPGAMTHTSVSESVLSTCAQEQRKIEGKKSRGGRGKRKGVVETEKGEGMAGERGASPQVYACVPYMYVLRNTCHTHSQVEKPIQHTRMV